MFTNKNLKSSCRCFVEKLAAMHKISVKAKSFGLFPSLQIRTLCSQDEKLWFKPQIGLETGIVVYNTVARRKVPVILPNKNYVSFYTCGPTVYDSSHLGHASCYVKLDIIQRILRNHFQMNLVTAMNITDIDDKIIKRSQETGKDWRELSRQYETEFWTDMQKLGVAQPNIKLRVTDHIPQIIEFIKNIIANGFAYVGKDTSVYFNTRKFPIYGKLQKVNLDDFNSVDNKPAAGKTAEIDFALWKAKKHDGEPSWDSPWGAGRPGWHIECSTLATLAFGSCVDFHAGGLDLRFPHHENEEAQCCVYHNTKQWINYWLHTGQLNLKGETMKMSKSLKNTISIDGLLENNNADEFRMACAMSNYRNSVEYSKELMEIASNTLNRFKTFHLDCQAYLSGKKRSVPLDSSAILKNLSYAKSQLDACYKDDFDTARAISILMEQISGLSRNINSADHSNAITSTCLDSVAAVDNFVENTLHGLGFTTSQMSNSADVSSLDDEINVNHLLEDLLYSRKLIRDRALNIKSKELFEICDELRKVLFQHGVDVRDHNLGSSWSFIKKK